MKLNLEEVKPLVELALREDIGPGDITTKITVPAGIKTKGRIIAKEKGIIAGLEVAKLVFKTAESKMLRRTSLPVRERTQTGPLKGQSKIRFRTKVKDGDKVKKGQIVAEISGPAGSVLIAERTALNFLQRLSGIATFTAEFVNRIKPYRVKIMDTRKTTPGWRALEKYAVRVGGGYNHRKGLYDGVLIKDNHIQVNKRSSAQVIGEMVGLARKKAPQGMKIEVEVRNLSELKIAVQAEADIIMLDNMSIGQMKKAVQIVHTAALNHQPLLEASGGVTLGNVREIAKTGVNTISVGALTHSAKGLDMSLKFTSTTSAPVNKCSSAPVFKCSS